MADFIDQYLKECNEDYRFREPLSSTLDQIHAYEWLKLRITDESLQILESVELSGPYDEDPSFLFEETKIPWGKLKLKDDHEFLESKEEIERATHHDFMNKDITAAEPDPNDVARQMAPIMEEMYNNDFKSGKTTDTFEKWLDTKATQIQADVESHYRKYWIN